MDIWGALLVLVRRFYITVPLGAALVVGGLLATHSTAGEYHASASMVLIGPTRPPNPTRTALAPVNPYVSIGISTLGPTLQIDADNSQALAAIRKAGNTTDFSVSAVSRTSIVTVTATSPSPQQAVSTVAQVASIIQTDLATRQKPYAPAVVDQMTAPILASAQLVGFDHKARTRAESIAVGAAVVVTVLLVLIVDSVLAARARRRRDFPDDDATHDDIEPQRTTVVRSS